MGLVFFEDYPPPGALPWVDPSPTPLALAAWGSAHSDPRAKVGVVHRRPPRPLPLPGVGAIGRAERVRPPPRRVQSPKPRERAVTPEGGGWDPLSSPLGGEGEE